MSSEFYICETNRLKAKTALANLKKLVTTDELVKVPRPMQGKMAGGKFQVFVKTNSGSMLRKQMTEMFPKARAITELEFSSELARYKFFW